MKSPGCPPEHPGQQQMPSGTSRTADEESGMPSGTSRTAESYTIKPFLIVPEKKRLTRYTAGWRISNPHDIESGMPSGTSRTAADALRNIPDSSKHPGQQRCPAEHPGQQKTSRTAAQEGSARPRGTAGVEPKHGLRFYISIGPISKTPQWKIDYE
jgi:hypothetical protein